MSDLKPKLPPKPENVLSPNEALARLIEGNKRYQSGKSTLHDFVSEREALVDGQNPFAGILSCSDSRIAPEYAFDTARGDLFVARVAGNFVTDEIIASFEFAVAALKIPLIVILGHESCGAVKATITAIEDETIPPGKLPKLVEAIKPSVIRTRNECGDLLENATLENVRKNVEILKSSSEIFSSALDGGALRVVGAIYTLKDGRINFLAEDKNV
jgi:carbonic anhydrase